jgi:hypothetical protein
MEGLVNVLLNILLVIASRRTCSLTAKQSHVVFEIASLSKGKNALAMTVKYPHAQNTIDPCS